MTLITYRQADPSDADAIGHLHADSWRRHYRGVYSDAYLDGAADQERIAAWNARLAVVGEHFTVVAERGRCLVGFSHTRLDDDPPGARSSTTCTSATS